MTNEELPAKVDREAKPLDLIYRLTTYQVRRSSPKLNKHVTEYNRWRASLPDHCWECPRFDSCYPARKCAHNPANNK